MVTENALVADLESPAVAVLQEALRSMAALGDAIEALPTTASPQAARSIQATENLVRSIETEFGMLSASEVGRLLGSESKTARNLAGSRHRAKALLAIRRGNRLRFPAFQFQADGTPLPIIAELRALAQRHGWSEFNVLMWLAVPTERLDGKRPVDALASRAPDVLALAELEMSTQW